MLIFRFRFQLLNRFIDLGIEVPMYNFSGGTAGKELRKEIAAGTEISLGGMNQEGRI